MGRQRHEAFDKLDDAMLRKGEIEQAMRVIKRLKDPRSVKVSKFLEIMDYIRSMTPKDEATIGNPTLFGWIYRHWDRDGKLLYIGKSKSHGRALEHLEKGWAERELFATTYQRVPIDFLLEMEQAAIVNEGPVYNIARRKSHCIRGHELTDENVSKRPDGRYNGCKECARQHRKTYKERNGNSKIRTPKVARSKSDMTLINTPLKPNTEEQANKERELIASILRDN